MSVEIRRLRDRVRKLEEQLRLFGHEPESEFGETAESIRRWARETFGPPHSREVVAARCLMEAVELIHILHVEGSSIGELSDELADVWIVAAQIPGGELEYGGEVDCGACPKADVQKIAQHLASLLREKIDPDAVKERVRLIGLRLRQIAEHYSIHLPNAVDRKMVVNRGRKWKVGVGGVGQHE